MKRMAASAACPPTPSASRRGEGPAARRRGKEKLGWKFVRPPWRRSALSGRLPRRPLPSNIPTIIRRGRVAYFLAHHGEEQIAQDVAHHCVLLGLEAGRPVGTVTIRGREICRLFVLPTHQGRGYGARLLDAAEGRVAARHGEIWLDASLSARLLYHKRGYQLVECHVIPAGEDFLCYDTMVKRVK